VLPTLCAHGVGGKKAQAHRDARAKDPAAKLVFADHWNEPDVRGALYATHGWVCAYCQCKLPRNDRGDVEHFRPKWGEDGQTQSYWWLAYEFSNYLLACRRCNSARKGTKFPLAPGAVWVDYANRAALAGEARLLAHPVEDPVEDWMRVEWEDPDREGQVVANVKVAEGFGKGTLGHDRATETIGFFKLNADRDLYRERRKKLEKATSRHRNGDGVAVRRMASRYQPFGIAVRGFLQDVEPELLPTPAEELGWLLEEIGDRLKDAQDWLNSHKEDTELALRMAEELCWTLAVLWKDPPTGDAGRTAVARWLEAKGLKEIVKDLYVRLADPPSPVSSRTPRQTTPAPARRPSSNPPPPSSPG
jgi:hypothetical protein